MAITLGTVTLPDDLRFINRYTWTGLQAEVKYSIGGVPLIWEGNLYGRPITLVGDLNTSWIDYETLSNLQSLASVQYAQYTLVFGDEIYNVRFRHEDSPVIEATPVAEYPEYANNDKFAELIIKLMEV
jgi:hypothetical protein